MKQIEELNQLTEYISHVPIAVMVFTMPACGVCQPLKDRVESALSAIHYDDCVSVDLDRIKEASGVFRVFTAPIILVFVEGKEVKRYSAALDFTELTATVFRYRSLMDSEEA